MEIRDKVAIVTGAGSGIGRAAVERYGGVDIVFNNAAGKALAVRSAEDRRYVDAPQF